MRTLPTCPPRGLLWGYLAVVSVLVVVEQTAPPMGWLRGACYVLVGLLSAGCALLVVRRGGATSASRRRLAAALVLLSLADVVFVAYGLAGLDPMPSPSDGLCLLAYGVLLAAVLARSEGRRMPRAVLVDAGALAVALALPLWLLAGHPVVGGGRFVERLVGAAYPVADLALLGVLVSVLVGRRPRGEDRLLALGLAALVTSDLVFALRGDAAQFGGGALFDVGYMLSRVLFACALLAPARRTEPHPWRAVPGAPWLLLVAALTATAPLSLLLVGRPGRGDVGAAAGSAVAVALLLLLRLSLLGRELRAVFQREREDALAAQAVAAAAARLLPALGRSQVQRAALCAVQELVPETVTRVAVGLALGPPALLELVAADGRGMATSDVAAVDVGLLDGAERDALAAGREVARRQGGGDTLAVLPLVVGGRGVGALAVRTADADLRAALPRLRLLAPQVALALEGARLRELAERARSGGGHGTLVPRQSPTPALVADLARGLREGEFVPYFQPIVGVADGRPRGFEALVRWQHPVRGLLGPGAFLPQVEESGLLGALDALVLRSACATVRSWDPSIAGPYVSVNVSAENLVDERFVAQVREVLDDTGLPPWRLLLEVTETAAVADPTRVASVLAQLRATRVRVAFDDFGTGYSSLSWLQQLPLDVVKVDKSFVDRLPQPEHERPVVEALVRLAQTMGLEVVAEGVEHEAQREALLAMGVGLAQGWLYAPALPAAAAAALLAPAPAPRPAPDDLPALP